MRTEKKFLKSIALATLLVTGFTAHGVAQDTTNIVDPEIKTPVILTTSPAGGEMNVGLGSSIEITFNSDMNEKSINGTTLKLYAAYADTMHEEHSEMMMDDQINDRSENKGSDSNWKQTNGSVSGTITYSDKTAVFTTDDGLEAGTLYTFTVTNGVKDSQNIALDSDHNWSFTTAETPDSTSYENHIEQFKMGNSFDTSLHILPVELIKVTGTQKTEQTSSNNK